ncbi:MAG: aspartyl-tRNA synthetase, partial [Solirubrobacteraceae bacterium]
MKQPPRPNIFRDAWCGELRGDRCGTNVRVAGWVNRRRDHGGLIFIDLRDRSGIVQLVIHPSASGDAFALAEDLRPEHVVSAEGEIVKRAPNQVNPNLATGEIELHVRSLRRLATSETPPLPVDEDVDVDENIRLRYRYIDLRRRRMQEALLLRDTVAQTMRETLSEIDFAEIETPILTRSTPEGARDFLVPSRLQPGSWYALPQSPQLFKQLLMISGYERYYQIARCFRDEDLRADRQPEFTQLDMELGFVEEDDVIAVTEQVMHAVFQAGGLSAAPP